MRILPLLLLTLLPGLPVAASPLGSTYRVDVRNFAGNAGAATAPVTFDGIEETPAGMRLLVDEQLTPASGSDWIEMDFRSSGGTLRINVPDPGGTVRVGFLGLEFDDPGARLDRSSFFLYFTLGDVPQTMRDLVNIGLDFRSHPLGRSFGGAPIQVLFFPLPGLVSTVPPLGIPIDTALFPTTFEGILLALGLQRDVTGLHVGFNVVRTPEPAPGLLLATALLVLARLRGSVTRA